MARVRTTYPARSGMGALANALGGHASYDRAPMMRPEDLRMARGVSPLLSALFQTAHDQYAAVRHPIRSLQAEHMNTKAWGSGHQTGIIPPLAALQGRFDFPVSKIPDHINGITMLPRRFPLYHSTNHADSILREGFRPSDRGEIGPGVYFSVSPDGTYHYGTKEMLSARTNRSLRLLNRDSQEGNKLYRALEIENTIEKGGHKGLLQRLQESGFHGVVHTSPGNKHPEMTIHSPLDVIGVRRRKYG